ncbi:MAG: hypothetical protein ABI175_30600 [Polyangiales bacterium]
MRWWPAAIALVLGCAPTMPPPPAAPDLAPGQQPGDPPGESIDTSVFGGKVAGLRATLARHGVKIDTSPAVIDTCAVDRYGGGDKGCVRCEVATRVNTAGVDPDLIDGVSIAFGAYPPLFIQVTGLEHVALCRTIRIIGDDDAHPPAGLAIVNQHRLMISIEQFVAGAPAYKDFSVTQVVHHEVFHLFDAATAPTEFSSTDTTWLAMNPRGFEYHDPAIHTDWRPTGFVNHYGTTNEKEDRATVFEFLLGQPTVLCDIAHKDKAVAAKVTGEKLLRQHARCVDWIGGTRKKPAAAKKPPPKRTGPVNLRIDQR